MALPFIFRPIKSRLFFMTDFNGWQNYGWLTELKIKDSTWDIKKIKRVQSAVCLLSLKILSPRNVHRGRSHGGLVKWSLRREYAILWFFATFLDAKVGPFYLVLLRPHSGIPFFLALNFHFSLFLWICVLSSRRSIVSCLIWVQQVLILDDILM